MIIYNNYIFILINYINQLRLQICISLLLLSTFALYILKLFAFLFRIFISLLHFHFCYYEISFIFHILLALKSTLVLTKLQNYTVLMVCYFPFFHLHVCVSLYLKSASCIMLSISCIFNPI